MSNQIARSSNRPNYGFDKTFRAIRATSDQTGIVTAVDTAVVYNTIGTDRLSGVLTYSTSTGIFTVLKEGLFIIDATIVWSSNGANSGMRKIFIKQSGLSDEYGATNGHVTQNPNLTAVSTTVTLYCTPGNTFQIWGRHTEIANLDYVSSATNASEFSRVEVKYLG